MKEPLTCAKHITRKQKADAERTGEKLCEMPLCTAKMMIIVTCNIQNVKKKLSLHMPRRHTRGVEVQHHSFLTMAPDGGVKNASFQCNARWAPEPVCTLWRRENHLAPATI